jgi:hypothetical protein
VSGSDRADRQIEIDLSKGGRRQSAASNGFSEVDYEAICDLSMCARMLYGDYCS